LKNTEPFHIAIIADPLEKQNSGVHYFTWNLVNQLLNNGSAKLSIIGLGKSGIEDQKLDAGAWKLDAGVWKLDAGSWKLEVGSWKLEAGNWMLETGVGESNGESKPSPAALSPQPATFYSLPNTLKFLSDDPIRTFITLPKLIKKLNPHLVIEPAHFGPFNLPKHIKRVTVIHDLTPIRFPKFHPWHSQLLQRLFLPGVLRRADLIITNSNNTRDDVLQYSPQAKNKTEFIHLGKDEIFRPLTDPTVLEKFGVRQPYFLFVGTIEPRKNLLVLLLAFELFKKAKPDSKHQLVIVGGKGWKSKKFHQALERSPYKNDIVLPGYVPREQLPVFYSMAEIFIYPSFYEGFGFPVLEAMACGTAVITSNVSSLPEVGGGAALYFDPNNVDALLEKILLQTENNALKTELQKKSLIQAQKFSWELFSSELINLLEDKFDRE
jgi:glycosyltransferase involved in cell wall biosynthesis